jgi:hypothetical protein
MDAATIAPPLNFPKSLLVFFLFSQAIMNGQTFFFVFFKGKFSKFGKFSFAEIDKDVLDAMKIYLDPVFQQIRRGQTYDLPWEDICTQFKNRFQEPVMNLSGNLYAIPWTCFILGARNLVVKTPEDEEIYVRYHGESEERGISYIMVKHRNTDKVFEVPTLSIVRFPTQDELMQYDREFAAAEATKEQMERMKIQGRRRPFPEIQKNYPNFEPPTLIVLFLLCRRFNIVPGFNYAFNLIVLRLSPLGDQSRFPIPQLSEDEKREFVDFQKKYDEKMSGQFIASDMARHQVQGSNIFDRFRRQFDYHCYLYSIPFPDQEDIEIFLGKGDSYFEQLAIQMSEKSVSALELDKFYWTNQEVEVELKKMEAKKVPHHCLFCTKPHPVPESHDEA